MTIKDAEARTAGMASHALALKVGVLVQYATSHGKPSVDATARLDERHDLNR